MRDAWDESFDSLSPYAYEAHRWHRFEHERPLVSGKALLVGVACLVLVGFVSADVTMLSQAPPATVEVTAVEWFVPGAPLVTTAGFSMHSSERVTVTLTCSSVCYRISGATVEPPFTLVSFSVAYHPIQYTNVTLESPSSAYVGPIAISLSLA
jgi:hypothetical protein